jgi:hypothetical protein
MIGLVAAASTVLAWIDDAVTRGTVPVPLSRDALLATVQARWSEAGAGALPPEAEADLKRLVEASWDRAQAQIGSGGQPVFRPGWGEVVADPFTVRRTRVDLARAWPEAEDPEPVRSGLFRTVHGEWAVPFADVRRRENGFGLPHPEDDALASLPLGTPLGDDTTGARVGRAIRPYWIVVRQAPGWTEVIPTGANPLHSGIGAGGATIGAYDLAVLSGEVGRTARDRALQKLRDHTAQIDDVKVLLGGTVPVQMGPNGAQGGWYNVDDRANQGHAHGLDPESILVRDAGQLAAWGFAVPQGARVWPPALSTYVWNQWVSGPPTPTSAEAPPGWLGVLRKRTERGRYRYEAASLAQLATEISPDALRARLDRDLRDFLANPAHFKAAHPYGPDTLLALIQWGFQRLDKQAAQIAESKALDIEGEDSRDPASLARQLQHPERRVSVRAARLAVQHAAVEALGRGPRLWRDRLHAWVRSGRGDWLGLEVVLEHFDLEDDREGLALGLRLPDSDNRRKAVSMLLRLDVAPVLAHLQTEFHPEVLRAAVSGLQNVVPDRALSLAIGLGLFDRVPPPSDDVVRNYHAKELANALTWWLRESELKGALSRPEAASLRARIPVFP